MTDELTEDEAFKKYLKFFNVEEMKKIIQDQVDHLMKSYADDIKKTTSEVWKEQFNTRPRDTFYTTYGSKYQAAQIIENTIAELVQKWINENMTTLEEQVKTYLDKELKEWELELKITPYAYLNSKREDIKRIVIQRDSYYEEEKDEVD